MGTERFWKVPCVVCKTFLIVEDSNFDKSPSELEQKENLYISMVPCRNCGKTMTVFRQEIRGPFLKQEIEMELETQLPPPKFFLKGGRI
jgi:hypothetical protein